MQKLERIIIVPCKGGAKTLEQIVNAVNKHGLEYEVLDKGRLIEATLGKGVLVIILGTDRDFLESIHSSRDTEAVYMLLNPPGYTSFFSTTSWDNVSEALSKLTTNEYYVEEYSRLSVSIDGVDHHYALNELAVFADRSGILITYTLEIDGEILWNDTGDGLIVSTPVGSTGYALSAGGPIVIKNASVLILVPVNSINPMRKPLVTPDSSTIVIKDLVSRVSCVAIIDGVIRRRIQRFVEIKKSDTPLLVLKLEKRISESIVRKKMIAMEFEDLPPSAKFIYKMLEIHGEMSIKDLVEITGLPERTVRHAIRILLEKGLVTRLLSLRDVRVSIYRVKHKV